MSFFKILSCPFFGWVNCVGVIFTRSLHLPLEGLRRRTIRVGVNFCVQLEGSRALSLSLSSLLGVVWVVRSFSG